jgi:nitroreductase
VNKEKVIKAGFKKFEYNPISSKEQQSNSNAFFELLNSRRSIREFSDKPIPEGVIENIIKSASTAPSGAHKQPWFFCVVKSKEAKKKIRKAAEEEEFENYNGRMSDEWLKDLKKFNTDWNKPFLEIAPALIVVFKKTFDYENGDKSKNYYVNESVGLATGMLLAAIHNAGLVSLTHTPSPLNFLSKALERPENEKPYLLIPIGYPSINAQVPILKRKELTEIMKEY